MAPTSTPRCAIASRSSASLTPDANATRTDSLSASRVASFTRRSRSAAVGLAGDATGLAAFSHAPCSTRIILISFRTFSSSARSLASARSVASALASACVIFARRSARDGDSNLGGTGIPPGPPRADCTGVDRALAYALPPPGVFRN